MIESEELKKEQSRLEDVSGKLSARIAELEPEVEGLQEQAADLRRRFWEEVSVSTATNEDFEESVYSIEQQEALLSERERSHRQKIMQYRKLNKLLESPYFGRIDFREDGTRFTESIYIGVSSFVDKDGLEFLIYDWRTPLASLYYDHSPGPAGYDTPMGPISGHMELKRQYRIQGGEILGVFDTSETIGDELLQQVLGGGADNRMKTIVSTIQKEQNAIIREDKSAMLIVQGAAGSGKTSAALQRVAYLLYSNRDRLTADQIVLFSPNPMFNGYVSTVLPELGEENMKQTTFQEYLDSRLGRTFALEDPFDQMEYVLSPPDEPGYDARLSGIRYKASERFLEDLQHYAQSLEQEGMKFADLTFRGRKLIAAERMKAEFYGYDSSLRIANRTAKLQEWLLGELKRLEREECAADWVEEAMNFADGELYEEAYRELHQDRNVFDFSEEYAAARARIEGRRRPDEGDFDFGQREEEWIRRRLVSEAFKPVKRGVKRMSFVDMAGLYARFFESEQPPSGYGSAPESQPGRDWNEIGRRTCARLERGELFCEDATPYLYLKELIEGQRSRPEIRHVFIDEGQDYSAFQYAFLKKMFPRARMTVLGDFSQAIFTQSTELSASDSPLVRLYGEADTRVFRLTRSYRSTREIVEFAKALLPEAADIEPFERSGGRPLLIRSERPEHHAAEIAAHLHRLRAEGFESVGIVTRTAAEAREAFESLASAGCAGLKEVTKTTPEFEKGTLVLPVYLAKGVEFDAVLIYDASERVYRRESERKLFYTACTRAMHRLALFSPGEWSPFVANLDTALYETGESLAQ
ncbi:RNA polymerase recycling motor HelD [Saccharibacillus deserti]|uniref:RNA polymerase recycling motor HelD n=1 Tax=Saccharibacillus deserti TaxID=1634444 RepID=UPI001555143D|nr:RNA polymerase recycling motor HelD [Saccharibacillus deserti]